MAEWYAHSLRFLGIKETGVPLRRFTHSPVPMHVGLVLEMQRHIERLHSMPWTEAVIRGDRITEYTTYGTYARHLDNLQQVAAALPALTLYYWWKQQGDRLAEDFDARLARAPAAKMVLVNSNMGIPLEQYRTLVAGRWDSTSVAPVMA